MTAPAYNAPARFPSRRVPPRYRRPWAPQGLPLRGPGSDVDGFDITPPYNDDPPPWLAATGLRQAQGDNAAIVAPMSYYMPAGTIAGGDEGPLNEALQSCPVIKLLSGAAYDLQGTVYVPAGARVYLNAAVLDRTKLQLGTGACIVDDCAAGAASPVTVLADVPAGNTYRSVTATTAAGALTLAYPLNFAAVPVGTVWQLATAGDATFQDGRLGLGYMSNGTLLIGGAVIAHGVPAGALPAGVRAQWELTLTVQKISSAQLTQTLSGGFQLPVTGTGATGQGQVVAAFENPLSQGSDTTFALGAIWSTATAGQTIRAAQSRMIRYVPGP